MINLRNRKKIAVIGLGYVGLPTAISLYQVGHSIIGIDVSTSVIESLNKGKSHLRDTSEEISVPIKSDRWSLTNSYDSISDSEIVIITVPTPITEKNEPNLSYVESAISNAMQSIRKKSGTILVLESTVYPGVTRKVINNQSQEFNMVEGEDFFFAYCPERINPGVSDRRISSIQRIVGCDDESKAKLLTDVYSEISLEATFVGGPEVAEAAKLIENVQRDVDIALTNEFAILFSYYGLDVEEILAAASSKWNFHRHKPGIGVGGHCIPVDPYYYLSLFQSLPSLGSSIVSLSRGINNSMPEYCAEQIFSELKLDHGDKIVVYGYSYKPNVGDVRNTPVEGMIVDLEKRGVTVEIFDPLCEPSGPDGRVWHINTDTLTNNYSAIIVATNHNEFKLSPKNLSKFCPQKRIYDGRRSLNPEQFIDLGWTYSAVGRGQQA